LNWNERFPREQQPSLTQIGEYIGSPLWADLCTHLEQIYGVQPMPEHSRCSGAPGWNVKYRMGGHALCTLYPAEGRFTCMVSAAEADAPEVEWLLSICTHTVRELYRSTKPFNGSRWLMIDVTTAAILEDAKKLIGLRARKKRTTSAAQAR
jgi:hypothetical protein